MIHSKLFFIAICAVFGDPHYKTFDGKMFDFQGKCGHVMLTDKCPHSNSTQENLKITVQSNTCGSQGVTCTREITLNVNDIEITMKRGDKKIEISSNANDFDQHDHIKVYQHAGTYVHIITKIGVSLLWDNATRIYVTAQPNLSGKLCGLCGNYDGSEANDFLTFQGDLAGNAVNFGDSWRTQNSCPLTEDITDTCQTRRHRLDPSKRECAVIKSDLFEKCHTLVDPAPYYERCVFDACGCDSIGDCDCLCAAIGAYAKECAEEGVYVNWRKGHKLCGRDAIQYFFKLVLYP